jgi:iron complex transport system ATP-binding protein
VIEVDRFGFSLNGREILRDLTFSIGAGERVAVIGPNGAGKTTLLKCLQRILKGGTGRIRIAGAPLESYKQFELAKRMAYVPQSEGRDAPFTVRELAEMARYPHLGPLAPMRAADATAIDRALEDTGMVALADRPLPLLSGGERQKALLAAALAQETDILLLDEPTSFLDPAQQADLLQVLGRVRRTILSVTHDLNEALSHADRVLALREGALVFDGPSATLADGKALKSIYRHDFAVGSHPRTGRPVLFP